MYGKNRQEANEKSALAQLYEHFEFRSIRPEEAEEAAKMETVCFPPNEACIREHMLARELVSDYCRREKEKGVRRMVLTCHEDKLRMYIKLGFRDLGESASKWGGENWHEMEILLNG